MRRVVIWLAAIAWLTANGVPFHRMKTIDPPASKSGGSKFVLGKCKETVEDARHELSRDARTLVAYLEQAPRASVSPLGAHHDRYGCSVR